MRLNRRFVNLGIRGVGSAVPAFSRVAHSGERHHQDWHGADRHPRRGRTTGKYARSRARRPRSTGSTRRAACSESRTYRGHRRPIRAPCSPSPSSPRSPTSSPSSAPIRSTQIHAMAPDLLKTGSRSARRHRSRADENGQPLARPLPAERFLLRRRDRLLRCGDARQEELGDRPLDRRLRHRRPQGAVGLAGEAGAKVALDQGYPNQSQDFTPVVLAIKCRAPTSSAPIFTFDNDLASSRASCGRSA